MSDWSAFMRLFLRDWQVAYRLLPSGSVFTDKNTPFIAIPNTKRYTAADPFLFNYNGVKYLFAELFDKKENIGKIGCCVFENGGFSDWHLIIEEPYHLSYPNIFSFENNIFIVPEANESKTVYAYKAIEFPYKWQKCEPIVTGRKLVDTTFLNYNNRSLMFTYEIVPYDNKKLFVYAIDKKGRLSDYYDNYVSDDDSSSRPGGNFFEFNGKLIRVSQDCEKDYGSALVFSEICECSEKAYTENKILHLSPNDISINKKFISGIHTYNADSEMEVIDFHTVDFSVTTQMRRIKNKLRRVR